MPRPRSEVHVISPAAYCRSSAAFSFWVIEVTSLSPIHSTGFEKYESGMSFAKAGARIQPLVASDSQASQIPSLALFKAGRNDGFFTAHWRRSCSLAPAIGAIG
jgi:hypothetical protein